MLLPLPQPPLAVRRVDVAAPPEESVEERMREREIGGRGIAMRDVVEELLLETLPGGLFVSILPLVRRHVAQALFVLPQFPVDVVERAPVKLLGFLLGQQRAGEVRDRRLER